MRTEVSAGAGPPEATARGRFWRYVAPYRHILAGGVLCVLAANAAMLAAPEVLRHAIDELAAGVAHARLAGYGGLLVGLALVRGLFVFLQRRLIGLAARNFEYDLSVDFYAHLQRLPARFFARQRTGDLMTRATGDLAAVRAVVGAVVMYSVNALFAVALTLPVMATISWRLTLVASLSLPLVAAATKLLAGRLHGEATRVQEHAAHVANFAQESLAGVRVIRAYGQERAEVEQFNDVSRQFVGQNVRLIRLTAAFYPVLRLLVGVGFLAAFWYGGLLTLRGSMTVGQFVQFTLYLGYLVLPLHQFGWVISLFQRGMASMERIHEIMSAEPAEAAAVAGGEPRARRAEIAGEVEFRGLTFQYDDADGPALKQIDLHVRAGQTVAFVGGVGAGKSTLVSLVPRLYEAGPGQLLIDGRPVEEIPLAALRDAVGHVPQETFLFSASIAENIAWGDRSATRADVERAARDAGLAEEVESFPDGFDTQVGERGLALSGGQRQRVAIARALIRRPSVLIMDDALSSVDAKTEAEILSRLWRARRGRTNLIVSHRPAAVKGADLIVVLADGRVAELGTHEELTARGGPYARLHARQLLEEELAAS